MDIIIAASTVILIVAALLWWMYFCFKNPGTASLLYLITAIFGGE